MARMAEMAGMACLSAVLLLGGPARAELPAGVPLEPFRGMVSTLLTDVRVGGLVVRSKALRRIRANGEFFLPYVLSEAERTSDTEWRRRLREIAADIRKTGRGRLVPVDPLSPDALAPAAEYPPWEDGVLGELRRRRRVALEKETLRDRPESLLAARIHESRENRPAELAALLGFAKANPDRIEEALAAARGYGEGEETDALAALARAAAKADPSRAAAIDLGIALLYRDDEREERLARVRKAHPDSEAALLAEEQRLADSGGPAYDRAIRLRDFADIHADTEAATAALAESGSLIASANSESKEVGVRERVLAYAGLAERYWSDDHSGGRSAWAGVLHFDGFYAPDSLTPAAREALLATSRMFYLNHFLPDALAYPAVTTAESFERRFRSLGVDVDAEYAGIEDLRPDDAAVKWQRAVFHANEGDTTRALGELGAIEKGWAGTLYARKSLATRAALLYRTGDFRGAAALFDRYVAANPDSAYTWLAALRVGHARFHAGEEEKAIAAYVAAETRFPDHPLLASLVPLEKARAFESLGRYPDAAAEYGRAAEAWPKDTLAPFDTRMGGDSPRDGPDAPATREQIERRASVLTRLGATDADLRRFLAADARAAAGATAEAASAFAAFVSARPDSRLAPDARERVSTLALAAALDAADPAERDRLLDLAEESGDDFGDFAAAWVRALLLLRTEGGAEPAKAHLGDAAAKWWKAQPQNLLDTPLEQDVAAVRSAVCPPPEKDDDGRYRVVRFDVRVKTAEGTTRRLLAAPAAPADARVLRFSERQLDELDRITDHFDGPKHEHGPAFVRLLGAVVATGEAEWVEWRGLTLPRVESIAFEDPIRSSARVEFRETGFSGEWLRVKRSDDGYEVAEHLGRWIE